MLFIVIQDIPQQDVYNRTIMNTIEKFLQELALFPERESGLRNIKRYSLYTTMIYRTDLWMHTRRVAWIVKELLPLAQKVFGSTFDPDRALALALVHDDAEIIFGDIQAGNKAKMKKEELDDIKKLEQDAIEKLVQSYPPSVGQYVYRDLLQEAFYKTSLESMIVDWADKYDAFGEALHELYAGNRCWTIHVENQYGKIDLPTEYYIKYFRLFQEKFPQSKELFQEQNNWFTIPPEPNILDIVQQGSLHAEESLDVKKGYDFYDQWIAVTLHNSTREDIEQLYTIKEKI